jgi:hypothetical protein
MKAAQPIPLLWLITLLLAALPLHAVEVRVSAPALERTLERQIFNQQGPDGKPTRHYLRGDAHSGCTVWVDDPHVTFRHAEAGPAAVGPGADMGTSPASPEPEDRIVVSVRTHARLGFGKSCFGITLSTEAQVSFIPEAQGESIGFRDARIEHLSANRELDLLLEPFLNKKMPSEMKVNAAAMMRRLMVRAPASTGYTLTLTSLNLQTMHVEGDALVVDLECNVRVDSMVQPLHPLEAPEQASNRV